MPCLIDVHILFCEYFLQQKGILLIETVGYSTLPKIKLINKF